MDKSNKNKEPSASPPPPSNSSTSNDDKKATPPAALQADAGITLKQVYGMLCWLQTDLRNSQLWRSQRLQACEHAIRECPHLSGVSVSSLSAKMEEIEQKVRGMADQYGGADKVPQNTRLFTDGPLFVIVNHAMSGKNTVDQPHIDHGSRATGAVRHPREQRRVNPLVERARRLTKEEVRQMRDEMVIRKQIAVRDARLLADWMAVRRRELEVQELRLRQLLRGQLSSEAEGLQQFEEYLRQLQGD
ncbi:hypothetical protein BX070DRAFT_252068 [Coemansia spiralis]|nr:hypothetical protein BX070DRAFT_252068 [Coemansia spiralis]